jgi:hypothetical protein
MIRVLLNKSCNRISKQISCFSKVFFDELYEKFALDKEFWDNDMLDIYITNFQKFASNISERYNYPLDKIYDNIPVIIINNWRFNNKLINYIIERHNKKDCKKNCYHHDINGLNDKLVIRDIDYEDFQDHEIVCDLDGSETLQSNVNYENIITDLMEMIERKYKSDEIELYFRLNGTNKYTKRIFRYHEWIDGEWQKIDNYDLSPDTY